MALVQVIPFVREVFSWSLLNDLQTVVNERINKANQHAPAEFFSPLKVPVVEANLDVTSEKQDIDQVDSTSEVVEVFSVCIPLELEEVIHHLRFENT